MGAKQFYDDVGEPINVDSYDEKKIEHERIMRLNVLERKVYMLNKINTFLLFAMIFVSLILLYQLFK